MLTMCANDADIVASSARKRIGRALNDDEKQELFVCWIQRGKKTDSVKQCNWRAIGDWIGTKLHAEQRAELVECAAVVHSETLRADRLIVAAVARRYGPEGLETLSYKPALPHLQNGQRIPPMFVHPSELDESHDMYDGLTEEQERGLVQAMGDAINWDLQGMVDVVDLETYRN